jgi:hypothetical protein
MNLIYKVLSANIRKLVLGASITPLEIEGVISTLKRLGYLGPTGVRGGEDKVDVVRVALAKFQKFYGVSEQGGEVGLETLRAITEARCSFREVLWSGDQSSAVQPCPWPKATPAQLFTLSYQFAPGTMDVIKNAFIAAMDAWKAAEVVDFAESNEATPDFIIEGPKAVKLLLADELGNAIAFATLPCDEGDKVCHFNSEAWAAGEESLKFNAGNVAMHEIGHVLGLIHSCHEKDIMYNNFSEDQSDKGVSPNDINVLQAQYGFSGDQPLDCPAIV